MRGLLHDLWPQLRELEAWYLECDNGGSGLDSEGWGEEERVARS